MKPLFRVAGVLAVVLFALLGVTTASAEDMYSQRTIKLASELHCPICAGESVAASQTELARQIRGIIEEKVQAGESDQEIKDYFVARYGQSILFDPPKSGFRLGLWWMPVVVVAVGVLVVVSFVRERTKTPRPMVQDRALDDDAELEAIAREVLGDAPDDGRTRV
ncbi:MAG: cytochrome c-type biogenesis protein CcmH [Thermomicrobiales bacterium]|nr:cytochrome c-type biogenesis protein CcmH [Thermomicrobiales bacterium]